MTIDDCALQFINVNERECFGGLEMKFMGAINSDKVIKRRYQDHYDRMPTIYKLKVDARVPLYRKLIRWVEKIRIALFRPRTTSCK